MLTAILSIACAINAGLAIAALRHTRLTARGVWKKLTENADRDATVARLVDHLSTDVSELKLQRDFLIIEDPEARRALLAKMPPPAPPKVIREVREVVRSYAPPYKSEAWKEISSAAARGATGWSWDKGARAHWLAAATKWMAALDRVAQAARLHLDRPTEGTRIELGEALQAAGLDRSRDVKEDE